MAIANKCRQSFRGADFIAPYGREEFLLIRPGASLRNGIEKANHIRSSVGSTWYRWDEGKDRQTLLVTVIIGISGIQKVDTAASVIERADKALCVGKHTGKNCLCSENDLN